LNFEVQRFSGKLIWTSLFAVHRNDLEWKALNEANTIESL
jgi:hypothetical protein